MTADENTDALVALVGDCMVVFGMVAFLGIVVEVVGTLVGEELEIIIRDVLLFTVSGGVVIF
jgi:hypothetical protein